MTINIKYCGGCNPRFDRTAVERRLREAYPDYTYRINGREDADAVIVICGCSAACAETAGGYGAYGRFVLWKESAWEALCDFLNSIEREGDHI